MPEPASIFIKGIGMLTALEVLHKCTVELWRREQRWWGDKGKEGRDRRMEGTRKQGRAHGTACERREGERERGG